LKPHGALDVHPPYPLNQVLNIEYDAQGWVLYERIPEPSAIINDGASQLAVNAFVITLYSCWPY
jgi:hypothetical protein